MTAFMKKIKEEYSIVKRGIVRIVRWDVEEDKAKSIGYSE